MTVKGQAWRGVRWPAFAGVCVAYLAVTVGESILAPLFPIVAADLDIGVGRAGLALGLLTGAIAVANVAGGHLLERRGARAGILVALVLVVLGAGVSATAEALPQLLVGQVLLGLAAGTFFAPGIQAVGTIAGPARRGLAMGIFGVAFSGGLALAALLGVLGDGIGWRPAFAVVAIVGVAAIGAMAVLDLPSPGAPSAPATRSRLREALGRATAVGSAAAVTQYGTVAFFPLYAVEVWDMSPGAAALLLAAGRVGSVPAKTIAGHLSDRVGALPTIRALGVALAALGGLWMLAPSELVGAVPAVCFVASVSAAFPVANVLALTELSGRGPLLGVYRSVQMGVGAVAAGAIGAGAAVFDLRAMLLLSLVGPAGLVLAGARPGRAVEAVG